MTLPNQFPSLRLLSLLTWLWALSMPKAAEVSGTLYRNDFNTVAVDKAPEDFLILDGAFAVKEVEGNRFLELPGAPLDSYGALYGPTEKEGVQVVGRVLGTGKGRRFPVFALGLNGAGGCRLQISPGRKKLEILKGDTVKEGVDFEWAGGKWTWLKLRIRKATPGAWIVEGKAWSEGASEPAAWMVTWQENEEPVAGRASLWASPISSTPIRFDDLLVTRVP